MSDDVNGPLSAPTKVACDTGSPVALGVIGSALALLSILVLFLATRDLELWHFAGAGLAAFCGVVISNAVALIFGVTAIRESKGHTGRALAGKVLGIVSAGLGSLVILSLVGMLIFVVMWAASMHSASM